MTTKTSKSILGGIVTAVIAAVLFVISFFASQADAQTIGRGGDSTHYYIVRAVDADTGRSLGAANLSSLPPVGYYWITPDRKRCLIVEGDVKGQPSSTTSAANVAQATVKVRCSGSKPTD